MYAPNLNSEIYRNQQDQHACYKKSSVQYDTVEIYDDLTSLLVVNDLNGRNNDSSLMLYKNPDDISGNGSPYESYSLESKPMNIYNSDYTISCAVFIDANTIFIADDCPFVHLICHTNINGTNHFKRIAHSDSHGGVILALIRLAKSRNCVSGGYDNKIKIWDLEHEFKKMYEEKPLSNIVSPYCFNHSDYVTGLAANTTNSQVFASCSNDKTSLIWDLREPMPAKGLLKASHGLTSIDWQPNSFLIAIGNIDGDVELVDARITNNVLTKLKLCEDAVYKLKFNPSTTSNLAVCANNSAVKVVNTSDNTPVIYEDRRHDDMVRGLAWKPNSNSFLTCGYDMKVITHNID